MATTKITDLTAYTDPVNTDVLPIVDVTSDVTKKVSIANVMKNASLGTAAVPGIAFDGDPNTGIYSPGADQVAISTGGSGRLFVEADGDVCIGQNAGNSQLTVKGSTSARTVSQFIANDTNTTTMSVWERSDGAVSSRLIYDGTGLIKFGTSTAHALTLDTNNQERLRITSAGLVGVGTSSPSRQLTVTTSTSVIPLRLETSDSNMAMEFVSNAGTRRNWLVGAQYNVNGGFEITPGTANGNTTFSTPALVIDSSSRVGIGTTNPSVYGAQLAVIGGSVHADRNIGAGAAQVQFSMGASSGANFGQIGNTGTRWSLGYGSTANTIGTEVLTWNSSGNVGIGTASVGATLHVNDSGGGQDGTIRFGGSTYYGQIKHDAGVTGSNIYNSQDTGGHIFQRNGNEQMRLDASSRLLLGTSSFTGEASLAIKASSAGAATQAQLVLQRGQTNPSPDLTLGVIKFADADATGHIGAEIAAQCDGGFSWSNNDYPTRLVFSTTADGASSPTERMRIDKDGNTYIKVMQVGGTANVHWSSTAGQLFVTSSSLRFKNSVEEYDKGLAEIMQMQPKYFVYNQEPSGKKRAGFIAEDFHDLGLYEYVEYWKGEEGEDLPSEIGYSNMVAILVKAIQELKAEVDDLKSQLA